MTNDLNLIEKLTADYNNAKVLKPFPTGDLAPRTGFYFIIEVDWRSVGAFSNVPVAKVIWSNNSNTLHQGLETEIQLLSLFQATWVEGINHRVAELIGKVIRITYGETVTKIIGSKMVYAYVVAWHVTDVVFFPTIKSEVIITEQPANESSSLFLSLGGHFGSIPDLMIASLISLSTKSLEELQESIYQESVDQTTDPDPEQDHFDENPDDTDLTGFDPTDVK